MRILILSQYFWPENFRINDVARALSDKGHSITILTGVPNYPSGQVYPAFRRDPDAFSEIGPVKVVRVPMLSRGKGRFRLALNYLSFALSAAILGAWKLRGQSFNRILVYQPSPATIGLPSIVLRSIKKVPLVFWIQDLWPQTLRAMGVVGSNAVLGVVQHLVRQTYRHSDHIVVQSKAFMPLVRRQAADVPVSYIPNWSAARTAAPPVRRAEGRSIFKIYFTGNLGFAQDLSAVMKAVAQLSHRADIHWYFVGEGSMVEWLRTEIASAQAAGRVHLLRTVPPDDLPELYIDADALLVSLKAAPLFELTVPSKIQSYLASGLPILAMVNGEAGRIVSEAGAGLVSPAGDADALARSVLEMAAMSAEERQAMGDAGRRYSDKNFSFPALMDELEDLLISVGRKR